MVVARFDEPIEDCAAAERQLKVTTTPSVEGAWCSINDRKAHWRPREYFPAAPVPTSIAIIYEPAGDGLYGQQDNRVNLRIGWFARHDRQTTVDQQTSTKTVCSVTMLDSPWAGTESAQRQDDSLLDPAAFNNRCWTRPTGTDGFVDLRLPVDSAVVGYRSVRYAVPGSVRTGSTHQLETPCGHNKVETNVSAGCLNLSAAHAKWFYEFSQPGDAVEICKYRQNRCNTGRTEIECAMGSSVCQAAPCAASAADTP